MKESTGHNIDFLGFVREQLKQLPLYDPCPFTVVVLFSHYHATEASLCLV